jgi:hypothetical protein
MIGWLFVDLYVKEDPANGAKIKRPNRNGEFAAEVPGRPYYSLEGSTFQNVEELRPALAEFRERCDQRWIVQRLGYHTPAHARQQRLALGGAA